MRITFGPAASRPLHRAAIRSSMPTARPRSIRKNRTPPSTCEPVFRTPHNRTDRRSGHRARGEIAGSDRPGRTQGKKTGHRSPSSDRAGETAAPQRTTSFTRWKFQLLRVPSIPPVGQRENKFPSLSICSIDAISLKNGRVVRPSDHLISTPKRLISVITPLEFFSAIQRTRSPFFSFLACAPVITDTWLGRWAPCAPAPPRLARPSSDEGHRQGC